MKGRTVTYGAWALAVLAAGLFAAAGCKSLRSEEARRKAEEKRCIPFEPVSSLSQVHVDEAAYPQLFSPQSYALWVGPAVTEQRRLEAEQAGEAIAPETDEAAMAIDANYLVIECHIGSLFEDSSIGYDVVGFRGIQVHLVTPEGEKVSPSQVIVGSELKEEPHGALKRFERTNLVVFPKNGLALRVPRGGGEGATARLVVEGYDSTFYFEWFPLIPEGTVKPPPPARDVVKAAKMGYNEFCEKVHGVAHRFD